MRSIVACALSNAAAEGKKKNGPLMQILTAGRRGSNVDTRDGESMGWSNADAVLCMVIAFEEDVLAEEDVTSFCNPSKEKII